MTREEAENLLQRLKNGDLEEVFISKEDFMFFREVLVKRDDFKHFRGIAQRGGDVIYQYSEEARS